MWSFRFIYPFKRESEREILHLMVQSKGYKNQGWVRLTPGFRNFTLVSYGGNCPLIYIRHHSPLSKVQQQKPGSEAEQTGLKVSLPCGRWQLLPLYILSIEVIFDLWSLWWIESQWRGILDKCHFRWREEPWSRYNGRTKLQWTQDRVNEDNQKTKCNIPQGPCKWCVILYSMERIPVLVKMQLPGIRELQTQVCHILKNLFKI